MISRISRLLAVTALVSLPMTAAFAQTTAEKQAVIAGYADIAAATYGDALTTAKALQKAVDALIATPSDETMKAARAAWIASRPSYQQSEVYRFGNKIVDDWEGKVNAWPLDEGLIDYVDAGSYGEASDENPSRTANIIANPKVKVAGKNLDARKIDAKLLRRLHEAGGVEANVATGYHAIEFLLWGQDLNGTGPGAGNRPWTDYAKDGCTNGHCDRRGQYLKAATDLLVSDLAWMAKQWSKDGKARQGLVKGRADNGISTMLTGMGSLSYGELAGERMKLGLMLHDPEEEHDCFSDNTHNSHYYDVIGIRNVYLGEYARADGSPLKTASLSSLVAKADPALDAEMKSKLDATVAAMTTLKQRAETREAYDQMIGPNNPEGNAVVQAAIDALTAQTRTLERVVASLKLKPIQVEGSDSLDDPAKVEAEKAKK